jgi:hypothetical protein
MLIVIDAQAACDHFQIFDRLSQGFRRIWATSFAALDALEWYHGRYHVCGERVSLATACCAWRLRTELGGNRETLSKRFPIPYDEGKEALLIQRDVVLA